MSPDAPNEDAPSREWIADTWHWTNHRESWLAGLTVPDGDVAIVNRWGAATVSGLLADFTPLTRVRKVTVLAGEPQLDRPYTVMRLTLLPDEPYIQFRTRLLDAIARCPLVLREVTLDLDIRVWVRTAASPDRPKLAWLSYPDTELHLSVDTENNHAYAAFDLSNTLFSPFTEWDRDPNPLHALNQPLLETALRRLRARATGPLDQSGHLPGTWEFGFLSDPDYY